MTTEILIIGAGPTGLTLALTLLQSPNPPRFRIVDKAPTQAQQSRALVVQPRSLEVLQQFGIPPANAPNTTISTRMRDNGVEGLGLSVFVWARRTLRLEMQQGRFPHTQFPLPMLVSQADTEAALLEALEARGVRVERSVTVRTLVQADGGVEATMEDANGQIETLTAQYVVGCDGAHSIVRHSAGLTFEGAAYGHEFILCDAKVDWGSPENEAQNSRQLLVTIRKRFLAGIPMKDGIIRLISIRSAIKSDEPNSGPGLSNTPPTIQEFQQILDTNVGGGARIHNPIWLSAFRLHHRAVDHYRAGRMFVAGDAAHIHSPVGGQGMNTGIQDAANLGWKLAAVVARGRNSENDDARNQLLLNSYHDERHPVGQRLLKSTDRMFGFMASDSLWARILRPVWFTFVLPLVTRIPAARVNATGFFTQLRVRYRQSPIVGTDPKLPKKFPVRGGWRAVDGKISDSGESHDPTWLLNEVGGRGRHWLVVFGGNSAMSEVPDLVSSVKDVFGASQLDLDAAVLYTDANTSPKTDIPQYRDVESDGGGLHAAWGFDQRPGYALVRPDGYVAYIGYLEGWRRMMDWLKTYPIL